MKLSPQVYVARSKRAREDIASRGLKALIISDPINVTYATGFLHSPSDRPLYAVLSADREPTLLLPDLEFDHAKDRVQWMKDIRLLYEGFPPKIPPLDSLAKILSEEGLVHGKIGVESPIVITELKKRLPNVEFVNASDLLQRMRWVKSEEELELIRAACNYTDYAMRILIKHAEEGVSELELAMHATSETCSKILREIPDLEVSNLGNLATCMVWSGPRLALTPHCFVSTRKLEKGDNVGLVTRCSVTSGNYGYMGMVGRTGFVGEPTEQQKKMWKIALDAEMAAVEACRPGVKCSSVYEAFSGVVRKAGYGEGPRAGYGMGLQVIEGPILYKGVEDELKAGMTLEIFSQIFVPKHGSYRYFDTILVRDSGYEFLTKSPRDIDSLTLRS
jgi:Xaa-Pro dipeptidase